jgi:hypothetical protein
MHQMITAGHPQQNPHQIMQAQHPQQHLQHLQQQADQSQGGASPPPFAAAPVDAALSLRITKLAEFTTRNGSAFEEQVRIKQGGNPEYAFLDSGDGSDFYRWCLFCMPRHLPLDKPLPEGWGDLPRQQNTAISGMPADVSNGFKRVLQLLQGTQVWPLPCLEPLSIQAKLVSFIFLLQMLMVLVKKFLYFWSLGR